MMKMIDCVGKDIDLRNAEIHEEVSELKSLEKKREETISALRQKNEKLQIKLQKLEEQLRKAMESFRMTRSRSKAFLIRNQLEHTGITRSQARRHRFCRNCHRH